MVLYLIQHGEAKSAEEDPERRLTDKGMADVYNVALFMKKLSITVHQIFHSNKKRAEQTAVIIAQHIPSHNGIVQTDGLAPHDNPRIWYERLLSIDHDTILVGHLPHLRRLSSLLLCGDEEREVIQFIMAGVVCLNRLEHLWSISWMITPDLIVPSIS